MVVAWRGILEFNDIVLRTADELVCFVFAMRNYCLQIL